MWQQHNNRYKRCTGTEIYTLESRDKLNENNADQSGFCFDEVMAFLKISTSLHKSLAAEGQVADGGLFQVRVNREEFLKLRGRNRIRVIPNRDGKRLKPEQTEIKSKEYNNNNNNSSNNNNNNNNNNNVDCKRVWVLYASCYCDFI
jgi:hypothetical protein